MTRLALLLAAMGALVLLGRSVQGRTASAPAPIEPDEYVPMAAWDDADGMCPNCQTPWKCNGPHLIEETAWYRETAGRTA